MKKIFIALAIAATSITFSSCSKMDLELTPEDYFASGSFWKTPDQVKGAMVGIHSQLRNAQQTLWNFGELRGGTLRDGTSFTGTASLNSSSIIIQDIRESSPGFSSWANLYGQIFQINNFIFQVESATYLSASEKGYYLGQAYGLRA